MMMGDIPILNDDYPELDHFMNETKSDVVFIVEEKRIPALKPVLALKSKVFEAMFFGNFNESKVNEIVVKDTTFDAFKEMIAFVYSEQLLITEPKDYGLLLDVYQLADRYQLNRLMKCIEQKIVDLISFENHNNICCKAYENNYKPLIRIVKNFLCAYICELMDKELQELYELNEIMNNDLFKIVFKSWKMIDRDELASVNIDKRTLFGHKMQKKTTLFIVPWTLNYWT